jgi:phage repressor protein C with HTH and peptisase S24 domain
MPKPFKVSGNSMSPTIKDGDFLTISTCDDYKVNDIVVLDLPELGLIVKRIKLKEHNSVRVIGDNPLLESSACHQMHSLKNIVGKVTKVN